MKISALPRRCSAPFARGLLHPHQDPSRRHSRRFSKAATCWAAPKPGTGKTAAFALPTLQRLSRAECRVNGRGRKIRTLVLAPTRELALQICESFQAYGRYTAVRQAVVYGGVGQTPQVRALNQGVDVLIATPGRLLDLMQQGFVDLSHVEVLILDEADRMLDMGFIHDLRRIVQKVPATAADAAVLRHDAAGHSHAWPTSG